MKFLIQTFLITGIFWLSTSMPHKVYAQHFVNDLPMLFFSSTSTGSYQIGAEYDLDFGNEITSGTLTRRFIWVQGLGLGTKDTQQDYTLRIREGFGVEFYKSLGSDQFIGLQYLPLDFLLSSGGSYAGSSARFSYQINHIHAGFEHARQGVVFGFLNPIPDASNYAGVFTIDAGYYRFSKYGFGLQWTGTVEFSAISFFINKWNYK